MSFLGRDDHGDFILDPNEREESADELMQAEKDLQVWETARRPWDQPPAKGRCPHEDYPCENRGECVKKLVWWRRYIGQIEAS